MLILESNTSFLFIMSLGLAAVILVICAEVARRSRVRKNNKLYEEWKKRNVKWNS